MDWRRSCAITTMQILRPGEGVYHMPVVWYFAAPTAKTYYGINAFTSGIWDRDRPEVDVQVGEQQPFGTPWYDGANVYGLKGTCIVGTPEQFAEGLTAADLAAPAQPLPECCTPLPVNLPVPARVNFRLFNPGTQAVFVAPGASTWTCPPGVHVALVECWGAGAIGLPGIFASPGAGSGGGAYARALLSVVPGTVYPLHVGNTVPPPSLSAAVSSFDTPARVLADAADRRGGPSVHMGGRAANCIGDVAFDGGNSGLASGLSTGGGGASAGPFGPGQSTSPPVVHGTGYPGGVDAGSGGDGYNGVTGPTPGSAPGGGGAGGINPIPPSVAAPGQIRISW